MGSRPMLPSHSAELTSSSFSSGLYSDKEPEDRPFDPRSLYDEVRSAEYVEGAPGSSSSDSSEHLFPAKGDWTRSRRTSLLVWVCINIADGFWIYYDVQAMVHPNPRSWMYQRSRSFRAFTVFMYLFGLAWTFVNLRVMRWFIDLCRATTDSAQQSASVRRIRGVSVTFRWSCFQLLVLRAVAVFAVTMPWFGAMVVIAIAQEHEWTHGCDDAPMYAVLDGTADYDTGTVATLNVARFYMHGEEHPLFSFALTDENSEGLRSFDLHHWGVSQPEIPLTSYPTLQSVQYNMHNNTITGSCTIPSSSGDTRTFSCVSGTFTAGDVLSLNLTSSVPLNNTGATPLRPSTSFLRARETPWAFGDYAPPSFVLEGFEPHSDTVHGPVLRTKITKANDCTQLKVCISGASGRDESGMGAEVLVPMGLALMRQAEWARFC